MRRLAALTMIGMALSACADGDGLPKADAPEAGPAGSSGEPPASSQPGAAAPGDARADSGLADMATALGVGTPSTPEGTPGAATGGAPVAGGTTTGGAAAPTQSGATDTGSASGGGSSGPAPSGGSGAPRPKIAATPEDCAMLAQVMAIVDHPQLRQLKADTGC